MLRRLTRFSVILIGVVAITGVAFASATLAAGPTSSHPTTTLSIGSTAQRASSVFGPGVTVTLTYSCFPGFGGKGGYGGGSFGDVTVTDLAGDQGFGSFSATCDDKKHMTTVFVNGFFNPGAGAASAFLCGFDCASATREVKIT